jgi:hypothetical protein
VECNREMLGQWAIDTAPRAERSLLIPPSALVAKRELRLVFHVDNPACPADFGEFGLDHRLLGLGFHTLRITPVTPNPA